MKKIISLAVLIFFYLNSFSQVIQIKHKSYQIYFDTILKEPIYTHYILLKSNINDLSKHKRTSFKPDPLIKTKNQGSTKDYKQTTSFYDKGHLSPDCDFTWNDTSQYESMYYTNCAPQVAQVNRGIWKSLENYIRKLGKEHDIEIWTGCIYKNSKEKLGKLQVPTFFWKIIKYDNIIECYKIPNIILNDKDFKKYKVNLLELKYIINDTKI